MNQDRPDVAIVCIAPMRDRATIGGRYSAVVAEALAADGLDVELWSCVTSYEGAPCGVPVLQVWRSGALAWIDIVRTFLRRRPAVVHLQHFAFLFGGGAAGELSTLALMLVLRLLGARLVVTLHDVPSQTQMTSKYLRAHNHRFPAGFVRLSVGVLFHAIGLAARIVIVHAAPFADRAMALGIPPSKIRVVPLIAWTERAVERSEARGELGIGTDERVVLFFGYATRYKGIENLLEAFALLGARDAKIRLLLGAGEHPKIFDEPAYRVYYAGMRARAERMPNVTFLGFIADDRLGQVIGAADVGIVPYLETHGASGPLNYFLACDRPVLVSEQVAEHACELSESAFRTTPDGIAQAVLSYFDGGGGERVRTSCDRMREALAVGGYVDLTKAAYAEARGAR